MHKLNKYEREYLVVGDALYWRNPKTRIYEAYPWVDERKALLDSFIPVDNHLLYMDHHGVNIHLCAYREVADGPILGFLWAASAEECFYGFDYFGEKEMGPFEVTRKEIVTYEYQKIDGSGWES